MTSRHASEAIADDAVRPTRPEDLPTWLASALDGLLTESALGEADYRLRADPESVTGARHFTTSTLRTWGFDKLSDDAALVISELVTNALRHGLPPHNGIDSSVSIQLRLAPCRPYVLCGVLDGGCTPPLRREPDFVAETGRGLHIVESFSADWGWIPLPATGKMVWALFGTEPY